MRELHLLSTFVLWTLWLRFNQMQSAHSELHGVTEYLSEIYRMLVYTSRKEASPLKPLIPSVQRYIDMGLFVVSVHERCSMVHNRHNPEELSSNETYLADLKFIEDGLDEIQLTIYEMIKVMGKLLKGFDQKCNEDLNDEFGKLTRVAVTAKHYPNFNSVPEIERRASSCDRACGIAAANIKKEREKSKSSKSGRSK